MGLLSLSTTISFGAGSSPSADPGRDALETAEVLVLARDSTNGDPVNQGTLGTITAMAGSSVAADDNDPTWIGPGVGLHLWLPSVVGQALTVPKPAGTSTCELTVTFLGGGTDVFTSADNPLRVGDDRYAFGTQISSVVVRDGVGGTTVAEWLASGATVGSGSYRDQYNYEWTVDHSSAGTHRATFIDRPVWLLGANDWISLPMDAAFLAGASDEFTVMVFTRVQGVHTSYSRVWHHNDTGNTNGWHILFGLSGTDVVFIEGVFGQSGSVAWAENTAYAVIAEVSTTNLTLTIGADSDSVARAGDMSAVTSRPTVGSSSWYTADYSGEIFGFAFWKRTLTGTEIDDIKTYMGVS